MSQHLAKGRKRTKRGTTVVEVMMAIAVLAIGATGVVSLHKVVLSANQHARYLSVASEVARTWVERLKADSLLWNYPNELVATSDLETDTVWLSRVLEDDGQVWFRPVSGTTCGIHDMFGREQLCDGTEGQLGPFCVNLRLSWLGSNQDLILGEVRVYWVTRNEGEKAIASDLLPCGDGTSPPDVTALSEQGIVRSIYTSTALLKNGAQ